MINLILTHRRKLLVNRLRPAQLKGFTIVELLIVIVVIGILAAISIVSYNGIQNRTYDSAVNSDLTGIAKKFELYKIDDAQEKYPLADLAGGSNPVFRYPVSKDAYMTDGASQYNLLNCTRSSTTEYALVAQSKSGKYFTISSNNPIVKEVTASISLAGTTSCPLVFSGSSAHGAGFSGSNWRAWTNG